MKARFLDISPFCARCRTDTDTYIHFLWDCTEISDLHNSVVDTFEILVSTEENAVDKTNCLLSNFNSPLLITIATLYKKYLFHCDWFHNVPSIYGFYSILHKFRNRHFLQCKYKRQTQKYLNIKPDTSINIYTQFCLNTAKSKFSLVSPFAD